MKVNFKISDLRLNPKAIALCLASTIAIAPLVSCNKQVVDFNKSFNVVIEKNDDIVSVMGIKEYTDYSGTQVQYVSMDDLVVVSSTMQTHLAKVPNQEALDKFANSLTTDEKKIISYDEMQSTEIEYNGIFNKDLIDFRYSYNKAIILSDDTATILNIAAWKDYDDDKIQIKLEDGTCILQNADKIKLINDENANEDSLKNYALSLVGNEEKIICYGEKNSIK